MIGTTTPEKASAAQALQSEAREVYRATAALGDPITGAALGARFNRSERWGQARIAEAKEEARATSPVLPSAASPASLPPLTPPNAETAAANEAQSQPQDPQTEPKRRRPVTWPVLLLMLPATVAIWSGWVGLGSLAGFGPVRPLPGIADDFVIDTAITLPIGMETYSAYALYVWLSGRAGARAVAFARLSALTALAIGAAGQIAYHLMAAAEITAAHPLITAAVACIPVGVLGLGAALAHLVREEARSATP